MNHLDALPPWAALLVAVLVLGSAVLTLIGSIGLLRLKSFYARVHAPTLGTTLGAFLMLCASALLFSLGHGRPVLSVILIGAFLPLTTPITLMLLVRAALARDRRNGVSGVPSAPVPEIRHHHDETPP
jgi:multicomponent K+:H+ antiporter subunit G